MSHFSASVVASCLELKLLDEHLGRLRFAAVRLKMRRLNMKGRAGDLEYAVFSRPCCIERAVFRSTYRAQADALFDELSKALPEGTLS